MLADALLHAHNYQAYKLTIFFTAPAEKHVLQFLTCINHGIINLIIIVVVVVVVVVVVITIIIIITIIINYMN